MVATEGAAGLLVMIRKHIPRYGATFQDILYALLNDYGSVGERRLHRQLAKLVQGGEIERVPRDDEPPVYVWRHM